MIRIMAKPLHFLRAVNEGVRKPQFHPFSHRSLKTQYVLGAGDSKVNIKHLLNTEGFCLILNLPLIWQVELTWLCFQLV